MQVASISLRVRHEKRAEALSTIEELMRRMRSWPGCLGCRLMTEADDATSLMLMSEWQTRYDLESFLTSREFLILKGMRILLREEPEGVLDEVTVRAPVRFGNRAVQTDTHER